MNPTEAVKSRPNACSSCTFACLVRATWKSDDPAQGDCVDSVPVPAEFGNAGTPAAVPLNVYAGAFGDPLNCSACSYPPRIGWSYMIPTLARSAVVGDTAHATPARGPQLFLSML